MIKIQLQDAKYQNVRNIIFDLGGVVLNLDYQLTIDAFKQLGVNAFDEVYHQLYQTYLFDKFDKGLIPPSEFRDGLREISGINLSDNQIDIAWNAMLLDLPKQRLELLRKISSNYRCFLLSNTNEIHVECFLEYLNKNFGLEGFKGIMEKDYFSCRMGMRKPDVEIYHQVLVENDLKGAETLFIDDSPQNIEGAEKAGLKAAFLPKGHFIDELFVPTNN